MDSGHREKYHLQNHKWGLGYRETVDTGYEGTLDRSQSLFLFAPQEYHKLCRLDVRQIYLQKS